MPSIDGEIDALFQGRSEAFTAARNELAKRAGARAAEVKALQKPTTPAWAVNQVYWHRRRVFDRLQDAATAVRSAHAAQFAGRRADVPKAEAAHDAALKAAMDEIHTILRGAGEAETSATLSAVRDTLLALPSEGPPGRLSRPLKPLGFEALLDMAARAGHRSAAAPARERKTTHTSSRDAHADADRRRKADAEAAAYERARRREIAALERDVREAQKAESAAAAAAAEARAALDAATREQARLQRELAAIDDRLGVLARTLEAREAHRQKAERARQSLDDRLSALKQP